VGLYWLQTLGCPKNQVDSDKLEGYLTAQGYGRAPDVEAADLVVVNTCAFIDAARQESIDTVLSLADRRRPGARLIVTGCMAERYGDELRDALPEVDLVAGFGTELAAPLTTPSATRAVPVALTAGRRTPVARPATNGFDLLELPRPAARAPWAYVKVAEGCDRICGFCAIPSFRGKQRSRSPEDVLAEVIALRAPADGAPLLREIVLVAQDLASYGRDRSGPGRRTRIAHGPSPIAALTRAVSAQVERTRLLYLYPSGLTDELIETVLATGVPYFDLSLQHVARPLLARMRRWGDGERFLRRIADIRAADPGATFRSSFILGYPGETERDHDLLLEFLEAAQLDWAGFFPFSREDGTHAAGLDEQVPAGLALERLRECAELQDAITAAKRDALIGVERQVLVDAPGRGRTVHEAPEIDGIVHLPLDLRVGSLVDVTITGAEGPDLHAVAADRGPDSAGARAGAAAR
jgi:ribosomal protein S12 methylthiotransferase